MKYNRCGDTSQPCATSHSSNGGASFFINETRHDASQPPPKPPFTLRHYTYDEPPMVFPTSPDTKNNDFAGQATVLLLPACQNNRFSSVTMDPMTQLKRVPAAHRHTSRMPPPHGMSQKHENSISRELNDWLRLCLF